MTSSTAVARKASHPWTSSDVNIPAIDEEAPSSTVDDDRTTSGRRPSADSRARVVQGDGVVAPWPCRRRGGGARRGHDESGRTVSAVGPAGGQRGRLGAGDVGSASSSSRSITDGNCPGGGGPEADVRHPCSNGTDRSPQEFKTISSCVTSLSLMNPSPFLPRPGAARRSNARTPERRPPIAARFVTTDRAELDQLRLNIARPCTSGRPPK